MKITFLVEGKIRGKARPRFFGTSKKDSTKVNVRAYKVKDDTLYEGKIKNAYIASGGVKSDKYIKMTVNMYFAIPKSYTKKRKQNCIEGIERPAKRPDIDNILKNILDALNTIAYEDDVQVIEINCSKYYTDKENDYIKITLEELN